MAYAYIGEIRMVGFNFAPAGWAFCDGSLLPISEYETLFVLIGTTWGGDGESTFQLPDLRGRVPIHNGAGFVLGQTGGVEEVTLTQNQIPAHSHLLLATTGGARTPLAAGNMLASGEADIYSRGTANPVNLAPAALASSGGNQPHTNLQPYLCVNYIISLFGIFPSPT